MNGLKERCASLSDPANVVQFISVDARYESLVIRDSIRGNSIEYSAGDKPKSVQISRGGYI